MEIILLIIMIALFVSGFFVADHFGRFMRKYFKGFQKHLDLEEHNEKIS